MNDEQRQPLLEAWFSDREVPPKDVHEGVARVMTEVPQTRQHGRWLPLPLHRPKARSSVPTPTDTIEYQPSPTAATNGRTPTVIGRTQTMFSPAKAISAGAIVFAIGGVMLIAQPFDQQSSVPGAATDEERAAPAEFTGQWWFMGNERLTSTDTDGDPSTSRGGAWYQSPTNATDPRFDGEVTIFSNNDDWYNAGNAVYHNAWRVENEDGAWQSDPGYNVDFADGSSSGLTAVFHGEGGYEGLVAVVDMEMVPVGEESVYWDLNGVIFDGDLPPEPEARPLP